MLPSLEVRECPGVTERSDLQCAGINSAKEQGSAACPQGRERAEAPWRADSGTPGGIKKGNGELR